MAIARRQTIVQLDDARIAALDQRAAATGRSRSDLIREAVDLLLATGDEAAIDAAILAGYARHPAPEPDAWTIQSAHRRRSRRSPGSQGEVWWVEPPDAGRRPYLVLTRQTAIPSSTRCSPCRRRGRSADSDRGRHRPRDGMPDECALSLDNLRLVPKAFFRERITRLSVDRMNEVCRALSLATGCA